METYHGNVKTPQDAIILFEACRQGLLPRVQRRLSEKERQSIKSGSVFVWDEREAGMRRWTDGKSWSASRVSGSFLTYREMEGKKAGNSITQNRRRSPHTEGSDDDPDGPDGYRYKPDGLMKQSFSITTVNHQKLHLISYFSRSINSSQDLLQPTNDPQLKNIRIPPGMYPESTVHEQQNVPPMNTVPMMSTAYAQPMYTLAATMGPDPHTIAAYQQAIPTSIYPSWPTIPTSMSPMAQHAYIARSLPTSSPLISLAEPLPQPMMPAMTTSSTPAPPSPPKAMEPAIPVELRPLRNSPEPAQKQEGSSIMDIPSEKFVNVEDSRVIRALDKNLGLLNEVKT